MDKFFSNVQKRADQEPGPLDSSRDTTTGSEPTPEKKALSKGVVLGKNRKPYFHSRGLHLYVLC